MGNKGPDKTPIWDIQVIPSFPFFEEAVLYPRVVKMDLKGSVTIRKVGGGYYKTLVYSKEHASVICLIQVSW